MGEAGTGARRAPKRWLVLATTGAALPVVVAALRAVRRGWIPLWDNAYPALRAGDVFTTDPPLLGTRSRAGDFAGSQVTNHPGPFEFEVLAPWVEVFGPSDGTALGMAFLNVVCIVGVAWLTFRRAGHAGAILAMSLMALLTWSMGSEMLFDPWPPHAVLFPFALFLAAAWCVADDDPVALPVLAVSASFVLQVHLGYVLLVPGVAVTALTLWWWRHRSTRQQMADAGSILLLGSRVSTRDPTKTRRARWGLVALGLMVLCWVPPLYEELVSDPGNLSKLVDALGEDTATVPLDVAVGFVGGTLALPPWWLPSSFESPAVDAFGHGTWWVTGLAGLLTWCASLAWLAWRAARRGRSTLVAGLTLAIVCVPLALVTVNNAPLGIGFTPHYSRFLWVIGAFSTTTSGLAVADELRLRPMISDRTRRIVVVVPAIVAVAAGLLAVPHADRAGTSPDDLVEVTDRFAAEVIDAVEGKGLVELDYSPAISTASWVGTGLMVKLEEAGVPFVVRNPELQRQLGRRRLVSEDDDVAVRLMVWGHLAGPAPAGSGRQVATYSGLTPAENAELRRLADRLRQQFEQTGGFPLDPRWDEGRSFPNWTEYMEPIARRLDTIDPAELVESLDVARLVDGWRFAFGDIDDLISSESFPVEQLRRWASLMIRREARSVSVYLRHTSTG